MNEELHRLRLERGDDWALMTRAGSLARLELAGRSQLLYPGNDQDAGLAGVVLRRHEADGTRAHRLFGPGSGSTTDLADDALVSTGMWDGLAWRVTFRLLPDHRWVWLLDVTNHTEASVEIDAVLLHDIALSSYPAVRTNEYYVSQYLDVTPVDTRRGVALGVRQNMPGGSPWALVGSLGRGVGWASDARQLLDTSAIGHGLDGLLRRALPSRRLQHEHTLAAVADEPATLPVGQTHHTGFFGVVVADHPAPTGHDDAALADAVEVSLGTEPVQAVESVAPTALFALAGPLETTTVDAARAGTLLGLDLTVVEDGPDGWFEAVAGDGTVVTSAAKERAVLRPHGHVLRTGHALTAESAVLTSTVYLRGVFASQLTQGHAGRVKVFSGQRSYLGLQRAHGLRCFVDAGDGWRLLDLPSAWALTPGSARWLYVTDVCTLLVTAEASTSEHRIDLRWQVLDGSVDSLLVAAQIATEGDDGQDAGLPPLSVEGSTLTGTPQAGTFTIVADGLTPTVGDAALHADGVGRGEAWVTWTGSGDASLCLTTDLVSEADRVEPAESGSNDLWDDVRAALRLETDGELAAEVRRLDAVLPWFAQNAFVHYLSPRGLEQFTGGGWGVRDVCQGPVGLLFALDHPDAARDVLLRVFDAQFDNGDWPQWFDFLPPLGAGQADSHGDIVYWPLLALAEYIERTGDDSVLDADVRGEPLLVRVHRTIARIADVTIAGSALPAYGHGDWNDSLQPADPALAATMVSTWTSVLKAQTFTTLAGVLGHRPDLADLAEAVREVGDATAAALRADLLRDGLLAGYGVYDEGRCTELLVHPSDARTGLRYGVLPWIHAISADLLTPDEAATHLRMIEEHLLGPDGARLFDRPPTYRGGPMEIFQRAEGSTFWGREIGLMYMHAHLRYAEALARVGDGDGLFRALCQAHPVGVTERITGALPRQSTCYYSSSDAVFADRYEAAERYCELMAGEVELEGGWRVYSSGPGLFLRLLVECLLGVRVRGDHLELDPVLDPRLDGLRATVRAGGRELRLVFRVSGAGCGVTGLRGGEQTIDYEPLSNPYRAPGARVALADLDDRLTVSVG